MNINIILMSIIAMMIMMNISMMIIACNLHDGKYRNINGRVINVALSNPPERNRSVEGGQPQDVR